MLCRYCKDLTINKLFELRKNNNGYFDEPLNDFADGVIYKHQPSYSALVESAIAGCVFCHALWQEFRRSGKESRGRPFDREAYIAERVAYGANNEIQICLGACNSPFDKDLPPLWDMILVRAGSSPPYPPFDPIELKLSTSRQVAASLEQCEIGRFDIDSDLAAESNFEVVRDWLRSCKGRHAPLSCPKLETTSLPTRVIDVGSDTPSLLLSGGRVDSYVALSHCWGGNLALKTTTSNLKSHTKGIPMERMPANFRDAVIITRKLGFRYLWVDALCIVQDSREDWETEAARMCDIYHKAALTIAAATAENTAAGMLRTSTCEPCNLDPPCYINLHTETGTTQTLSVTRLDRKEESWYQCIRWGPLAERGWTLQEQQLSPRFLAYGERQVYWRCGQANWCSDRTPEFLPTATTLFSDDTSYPRPLTKQNPQAGKARLLDMYNRWHYLLGDYCNRKLTVKSDKLPALAGLAAQVHTNIGDIYLAGLWRGDLKRGLLWYYDGAKNEQGTKCVPERIFAAPSWSWAKIDGRVANHVLQDRFTTSADVELVDHTIMLAGLNPYGEVKSGTLVLHGLIYQSGWEKCFEHCTAHWDFGIAPHDNDGRECYFPTASDKTPSVTTATLIYTFLLVRFNVYRRGPLCPCLLILYPLQDREDVYQRVGYAMLTPNFFESAPAKLRTWQDWPLKTISLI